MAAARTWRLQRTKKSVAPPRAKVSPTPGTVMVRFAVSAARMTRWNAPLLLEETEL